MTASTVTQEKATAAGRPERLDLSPISWAIEHAGTIGPKALQASLAVLFVWFGAMKLLGASPVAGLISEAVPFVDPSLLIPALGVFEVVLGVTLLTGANLAVLVAMSAHLVGTFSVFLFAPELSFQGGNPLLLTTEGEFVMKNLVLLASAVTLIGFGGQNRSRSSTR